MEQYIHGKRSRYDEYDEPSYGDDEVVNYQAKRKAIDPNLANLNNMLLPNVPHIPTIYDIEIPQLEEAIHRCEPRNIVKMYFPYYKPTEEEAVRAKIEAETSPRLPKDVAEKMGLTGIKPYINIANIVIDEIYYSDILRFVAAIDFLTKKANYITPIELDSIMARWNSNPIIANTAHMLLATGGSVAKAFCRMTGRELSQIEYHGLLKEYIAYCGQIESNLNQFSIISLAKVIDMSIGQAVYCLINCSYSPHEVANFLVQDYA